MKTGIWILLAFLCVDCGKSVTRNGEKQETRQARKEILDVFNHQKTSWNQGSVTAYMHGYWNSDSLQFVSGNSVSYGWQKVHDNYLRKYDSKSKMGVLDFEVIHLEILSPTAAFMLGTWTLKRDENPLQGKFTLLWKKKNGQWKIVLDHTS